MTVAGAGVGRVVLAPTARIRGGVWRHVRDLACGLLDHDVSVALLLPPEATELHEEVRRLGLPCIRMAEVGPGDLFHLHLADTYDRAATSRLLGARRRGAHTVLTEHLPRTNASDARLSSQNTRMGSHSAKTAFKLAQFGLAHRVIAPSAGSRRFLIERYRVDEAKVVAITNGVRPPGLTVLDPGPLASAAPRSLGYGSPRFVAAGSVIMQKGFDVLVEAAYKAATDWTVDVYGEGPHRARLAQRGARARTSDGSPRLAFHGWSDDLARIVASADAVVMPSRWESSGYAALDAMALGRPVIGSRVDGLEDIIDSGVTGFLVKPEEAVELAAALDTVAANSAMAIRMGVAARERVQAEFGLPHMVAATLDLYRVAALGLTRAAMSSAR
jgi:glycosyltransferase involved in cell wall biosynthesis